MNDGFVVVEATLALFQVSSCAQQILNELEDPGGEIQYSAFVLVCWHLHMTSACNRDPQGLLIKHHYLTLRPLSPDFLSRLKSMPKEKPAGPVSQPAAVSSQPPEIIQPVRLHLHPTFCDALLSSEMTKKCLSHIRQIKKTTGTFPPVRGGAWVEHAWSRTWRKASSVIVYGTSTTASARIATALEFCQLSKWTSASSACVAPLFHPVVFVFFWGGSFSLASVTC